MGNNQPGDLQPIATDDGSEYDSADDPDDDDDIDELDDDGDVIVPDTRIPLPASTTTTITTVPPLQSPPLSPAPTQLQNTTTTATTTITTRTASPTTPKPTGKLHQPITPSRTASPTRAVASDYMPIPDITFTDVGSSSVTGANADADDDVIMGTSSAVTNSPPREDPLPRSNAPPYSVSRDTRLVREEKLLEAEQKAINKLGPLAVEFTDLERVELRSLVANIRLRGEPILNLAVLVANNTNKPVTFYAHFTGNQLQQLGQLAEFTTPDLLLKQMAKLSGVGLGKSTANRVNEFVSRVLTLLSAEERRRILFKSSTGTSLLTRLETMANIIHIDISPPASLSGNPSLAPILFRDQFYAFAVDNFREIKQRVNAQWTDLDEICNDKTATSDFANYLAEKHRMDAFKGYRSMVIMADHYEKLKYYASQLQSHRAMARSVVARTTSVAPVGHIIIPDPTDFYGNTLAVWRALVKEIGPERARQYLPYVQDFASVNGVNTD
jgi:hypothetical protein